MVEQDAEATAETVQVVPVNVNAPVAEPSHGAERQDGDGCGCQQPKPKHDKPANGGRHEGDVEQSNDASSSAAAGNVAIVEQTVEQTAQGHQPPAKHDDKQGREPGKDRDQATAASRPPTRSIRTPTPTRRPCSWCRST